MAIPKAALQKEPNAFTEMKAYLEAGAKTIIDSHKGDEVANNYAADKASELSTKINNEVIAYFSVAYPTYKFCSSCLVINNKEGGVHLTSSCFWEEKVDGNIQLESKAEDFKAIRIFLNVFVLY
jgi:hypothetical protein